MGYGVKDIDIILEIFGLIPVQMADVTNINFFFSMTALNQ